jgi:hypothetical protein
MARIVPLLAAQHAFLADPRGKEILVTPVRVRLTWLAEEADRGSYLLLRQADFTAAPIPTETIRGLLDRASTIAEKIMAESPS